MVAPSLVLIVFDGSPHWKLRRYIGREASNEATIDVSPPYDSPTGIREVIEEFRRAPELMPKPTAA